MKRTILLILMVVLTTISYSKSAKLWVQELDLVDISALNPKDVSSFWNAERNADADYNTLLQAIQKTRRVYCLPRQTSKSSFIHHIQTETVSLSTTALLMPSVTVLKETYI